MSWSRETLKCCEPTVINNRIMMLVTCHGPVVSAVFHEEKRKAYFLCFKCNELAILGWQFTPMDVGEAIAREVMES